MKTAALPTDGGILALSRSTHNQSPGHSQYYAIGV
jgi:hypothetical protein